MPSGWHLQHNRKWIECVNQPPSTHHPPPPLVVHLWVTAVPVNQICDHGRVLGCGMV